MKTSKHTNTPILSVVEAGCALAPVNPIQDRAKTSEEKSSQPAKSNITSNGNLQLHSPNAKMGSNKNQFCFPGCSLLSICIITALLFTMFVSILGGASLPVLVSGNATIIFIFAVLKANRDYDRILER